MKKVLYIIPGWEETTRRRPYQQLKHFAENRGYDVVYKNINWEKPLSHQVFSVPSNAVVFGFSLGAILAWLVAQKYPYHHVILASMTPHSSFKDPKIKKLLIDLCGRQFISDIIKNIKPKHKAKKQTIIYGDLENEEADILVSKTDHGLNDRYIKEILKLL